MSTQRQRLDAITALLLDPDCPPGELLGAAQSLHDLLIELTGWNFNSPNADRETQLQHGVAISPLAATRCILDSRRTASFLRGVDHAILEMRRRRPGRPVEVLYAGCGPLAPLLLPLAPRYGPEKLRVTLLEIHEDSLASARRLFETLGLSDRVRNCVPTDALEFDPPAGQTWDVCIVEMLQMALEKEPQLAVTAQLAPQLAADGILVPERITVNATLADLSREFSFSEADETPLSVASPQRVRVELGTILELDRVRAPQLFVSAREDGESGPILLPTVACEVPETLPENCRTPIVRTTIQITPSIVLEDYDSGLTVPRIMNSCGYAIPGEFLEFRYGLGERPGFVARRVP